MAPQPWVPRMTRSREVICEQSPTFAKATGGETAQPIEVTEVQPKAAPQPVVQAQSTQRVVRSAAAPVIRRPRVSHAPIVLSNVAAPCGYGGPCSEFDYGASPVHETTAKAPVSYREARPGEVSNSDRIVPRHVYEQQRLSRVSTPYAYKKAWDDDRLNPKRAHQTLKGRAQMALVWTNTVPRELVDSNSGQVVTAKYPKLVYPFTSMAQQTAYLSTKQSNPTPKKVAKVKARKPVAAAKASYVQIGVFGQRSNADFAAAQLTRLGMPAKVGLFTKSGTEYQVVMAGPYTNASAANAALSKLRRAGYSDAYLR